MIEQVEVFLGEKKIEPSEMKNYICINEYVGEIVNEAYYRYFCERKPIK